MTFNNNKNNKRWKGDDVVHFFQTCTPRYEIAFKFNCRRRIKTKTKLISIIIGVVSFLANWNILHSISLQLEGSYKPTSQDASNRISTKARTGEKPPSKLCPPNNKTIDALFPQGMPQNLTFGRPVFRGQSARPFLSMDIWYELVDNKRTFFLRPQDEGFPSFNLLRSWIRSRTHQISLVFNNNHDKSWPVHVKNLTDVELLLNEPNLHAIYAANSRSIHPKLRPIPSGPKHNWISTRLYGEEKYMMPVYRENFPPNASGVHDLFTDPKRTDSIFMRRMTNSNTRNRGNYDRYNKALNTARYDIPNILKDSCPRTMKQFDNEFNYTEYFQSAKKHRFCISPAGNGLDTHATWEFLTCGCIPIVPHSDIDLVFENLPVWLVHSWEEVTDEAVLQKSKEFQDGKYNFDLVFASGWKEKIHEGLCAISD